METPFQSGPRNHGAEVTGGRFQGDFQNFRLSHDLLMPTLAELFSTSLKSSPIIVEI